MGDCVSIEGAGSSAQFVENGQRVGRRLLHDGLGLLHFHEERAFVFHDSVVGSDAGEDAVDEGEAAGVSGNEATDLGEDDGNSGLTEEGGLATHVGASDEMD